MFMLEMEKKVNLLKKYQITYKKQEKITELQKLFDLV